MKRLSPSRLRSSLRTKLATAIAAVLTAGFSASAVAACDYCDQGDGGIVACDGCSSRVAGSPNGPLFRGLDAIAGGVEKFLGLDKCGSTACDAGCDACDAGLMQELMTPMPPATSTPEYYEPVMPTVPPESYSEPFDGVTPSFPYEEPVFPQPTPLPPVETLQPNGDGIFDSLKDPFRDDEVRRDPRPRSVQPSSFQRSVGNAARPASPRVRSSASPANSRAGQPSNQGPASYRPSGTSNSLKRAAARPTTSRSTLDQSRTLHRHGQQQVQLNKAPATKANASQAMQNRRQPTGQRHAWFPVNSYGQAKR